MSVKLPVGFEAKRLLTTSTEIHDYDCSGLDYLVDKYGRDAKLSVSYNHGYYDSVEIEVHILTSRLETDEEVDARIKAYIKSQERLKRTQEEAKKASLEKEKALYEKLRQKFEKFEGSTDV